MKNLIEEIVEMYREDGAAHTVINLVKWNICDRIKSVRQKIEIAIMFREIAKTLQS